MSVRVSVCVCVCVCDSVCVCVCVSDLPTHTIFAYSERSFKPEYATLKFNTPETISY